MMVDSGMCVAIAKQDDYATAGITPKYSSITSELQG